MMEALKKLDRHVLIRRSLDLILIGAMVYAALLAFGIVRRGGHFEEGRAAPAFTVYALEGGKELSLADYSGKPVVLNFFSTGCPSCRRELPHLAQLKERAGDRLEVLVISADPPGDLRAYMGKAGIGLPVAYDRGAAHRAYNVDTIPYLVLIDKEGNIRADYVGGIRWSDVEAVL